MNVDKSRRRRGFTLIEILIVMTILIILAGLAAVASRTAISMSRNSATKVLLAQIQAALDEKMQKFMTDTQANMPIDNYRYFAGHNTAGPVTPSSTTGQRAAIIARMDMMRSAFPQTFAEMIPPAQSSAIQSAVSMQGSVSAFVTYVGPLLAAGVVSAPSTSMPNLGTALAPVINPHPSHQSIFVAYLLATGQLFDSANPGNAQSVARFSTAGGYDNANGWFAVPPVMNYDPTVSGLTTVQRRLANDNPASAHDPETESAECLYLILADKAGGVPSIIDELPSQFIKDTDGDGLFEIVDSWGKPIKFYRWSTDTMAYFIEVTQQYKGVGKPGDVDLDGVADTILGSNSLDSNNVLYTDSTWFLSTDTGAVGGLSANVKDIFECLFGRLHGAYSYTHPPASPNLTSVTPNIDSDSDAIEEFNAVNNRNEHGSAWSGANTWSPVSRSDQVPRSYPFRSLVVSAGSDGQFGMYDLNSTTSAKAVTYPQIHIGMRCGRVEDDVTKRPYFNDNVFSIDLQEGVKQ